MLVRFDPFRELDRMFDSATRTPRQMPMDVVRRGDHVVVRFDLPGFTSDSIDLTVERGQLTVTAERPHERADGEEWLVNERPVGRFTRQLLLGDNLDTDHIDAAFHDGVLEVTIPVAEQAKPRKVEISNGSTHLTEAIEASSTAA
jgi:HSP20 family protein